MPETFDPAWLALREPVDHRSRSNALLAPLRAAWRERGWSRIVDLGCGAGSNVRYVSAALPGPQDWTLVDRDPTLLRTAGETSASGVRRLTCVRGDLSKEGLDAVDEADLVTGSALLDLVSVSWLRRLVEACQARYAGALFSLTYDGTIAWSPTDDRDDVVREAVNGHQRLDKGLGPALGPSAGAIAERLFHDAGFRTWLAPSPWRLDPADARLVEALVDGWERAALAWHGAAGGSSRARDRIAAWAHGRRLAVARGLFQLTVGHVDLLALPGIAGGNRAG